MDKINTPKLQEAMRAYLKGYYETAYIMFCELLYSNGRGVQQDYCEAFKWYMKASGTGHGRGVEGLAKVERLLVNHLNATPQIFNLFGFLKKMK